MNNEVIRASRNQYSFVIIGLLLLVVIFFPNYSIQLISDFTQYVINEFGLGIILFSTTMALLTVLLSISPIGKLRLGGTDAKPEFSTLSWLAMLFTAGMGSGLVFWGVAEPIFHSSNLPAFAAEQGKNSDSALALTYFHWGIHAWSIYGLAGLAIAWFGFNRERSFHISSSFTSTKQGHAYRGLDLLAIIAILFGVAGAFANSIALIQTGLQQVLSTNLGSVGLRYGLVIFIAILFTASSLLGLHKGIKRVSQFNTLLMLVLLGLVFLLLDPWHTLNNILSSVTRYIAILPKVSFSIETQSRQWSLDWSVIYIVWWVAWAPFVGPFIARISRGRSIRQFLLSVTFVPTIASVIWFSSFGGAAFEQPYANEIIQAVNQDYTAGLFRFFDHLPMGQLFSLASIVLLITFIITSADSALLVCGILGGDEGRRSKLLWAAMLVTLSMVLIYINDVDLNKQIAIAGALPFTLVMIAQVMVMLIDMWKYDRTE